MRDSHRMKEKFDVSLDNRQIVSLLIASIIVLGAVFVLGVVVGKKLAGNAQAAAAPDLLSALDAHAQALQQARETEPSLTFQDELTRRSPSDPPPPKPGTVTVAIPPPKPKPAEPKPAESKPAAATASEDAAPPASPTDDDYAPIATATPEPKPTDAKAADAKAGEHKPSDAKVADAKGTKPADAKADAKGSKPADAKVADAKGSKPADAKAADAKGSKLADAKAAEHKPADTKVADSKPATPSGKVETAQVPTRTTTLPNGGLKEAIARATQKPTETVSGGPFTLQISAFQNQPEAERFAAKLRDRGYAPFIVPAEVPKKGTWYRVRMGNFPSKEAASRYLSDFKRETRIDAFVASAN